MTAKKKSQELVDRYYWVFGDGYLGDLHIQCALIAVDEIIKLLYDANDTDEEYGYWTDVKQEIQNYEKN